MAEQSRRKLASAHPQKGAQDAAFQESGLSPAVSVHTRSRLQHFQRPASPDNTTDPPSPPRCGDEHMARGRYGCISSRERRIFLVLKSDKLMEPLRVVLDPARARVVLSKFLLAGGDNPQGPVKDNRPGRRRALINGEDMAGHESFRAIRRRVRD